LYPPLWQILCCTKYFVVYGIAKSISKLRIKISKTNQPFSEIYKKNQPFSEFSHFKNIPLELSPEEEEEIVEENSRAVDGGGVVAEGNV